MWITSNLFSIAADTFRRKKIISTAATRKLFSTIGKCEMKLSYDRFSALFWPFQLIQPYIAGLAFPAAALVGASFTGCDAAVTVTLVYCFFLISYTIRQRRFY